MSEVEEIRAEAADVQRIATGKLAWCAEDKVQQRYAKIPDALRSIERAGDARGAPAEMPRRRSGSREDGAQMKVPIRKHYTRPASLYDAAREYVRAHDALQETDSLPGPALVGACVSAETRLVRSAMAFGFEDGALDAVRGGR